MKQNINSLRINPLRINSLRMKPNNQQPSKIIPNDDNFNSEQTPLYHSSGSNSKKPPHSKTAKPSKIYEKVLDGSIAQKSNHLLGCRLSKAVSLPQKQSKLLVLYFEGFGFGQESIDYKKSTLKSNTGISNAIYYGEEQENEQLHYYSLIGAVGTQSPIGEDVQNFVDRAYKTFANRGCEKVICVAHSFGAYILSEVLVEMNDRYQDEAYNDFEKFYKSFSKIFMNRPFISNKYDDLKGFRSIGSLFFKPVEINKNAIKDFVQNNKENTQISFYLSEVDEIINYQSQSELVSGFSKAKLNMESKVDKILHNSSDAMISRLYSLNLNKKHDECPSASQVNYSQQKPALDANSTKSKKSSASSFASKDGFLTPKSTIPTSKDSQSPTSHKPQKIVFSPKKSIMSSKLREVVL